MVEQIPGTNMWRLDGDEFVTDGKETIHGPTIVRVWGFEELDALSVQDLEDKRVEVAGTDFAKAVSKDAPDETPRDNH